MEYSITSLAKQARVTVRTLRHYDQVGLLKPERLDPFRASQNAMKEMEEIQVKEFGKETIEKGKEKLDALSADEVDERTHRESMSRNQGELSKHLRSTLAGLQKEPETIRNLFQAPSVRYAA
ncbi:MAG TPA: MerR family DNA-binding transcriptional regulator [Chlamydiales bacterium]|nr:MerR family DNA-binding transcriptional regulator [Chlamydiales bacterium]